MQDVDGFVVRLPVYGVRETVLASVGEGETGRVADTGFGAVDELADQGQGAEGLGADPPYDQELLEGFGLLFVGREKDFLHVRGIDVFDEHRMSRGHL